MREIINPEIQWRAWEERAGELEKECDKARLLIAALTMSNNDHQKNSIKWEVACLEARKLTEEYEQWALVLKEESYKGNYSFNFPELTWKKDAKKP